MDNVTRVLPDIEDTSVMFTITAISGLVIFVVNVTVLIFISKLLIKLDPGKEQFGVITHMFYICANDTLSSMVLIWIGFGRVTGNGSARLCVYIILLSSTLQTMSQSTITCICALRYYIAKNVRKIGPSRHSLFTVVLLVVNVTVGILSMTSMSVSLEMKEIPDGTNIACKYVALVTSKSTFVTAGINTVIGSIITIVADVLCFMTVHRLKREINQVHSESTSTTMECANTIGTARHSVKNYQQNAIFTVFLILLLFNISALPFLVVRSLVFAGIHVSTWIQRITHLCLFLNSFFNPIIIAKRVPEINKLYRQVIQTFKHRIPSCF